MSAYISARRTTPFHHGLRPRISAAVRRFRKEFRHAMRVVGTRRDVSRLDDRMLADLGISRAQAAFEARRAPWRLD